MLVLRVWLWIQLQIRKLCFKYIYLLNSKFIKSLYLLRKCEHKMCVPQECEHIKKLKKYRWFVLNAFCFFRVSFWTLQNEPFHTKNNKHCFLKNFELEMLYVCVFIKESSSSFIKKRCPRDKSNVIIPALSKESSGLLLLPLFVTALTKKNYSKL